MPRRARVPRPLARDEDREVPGILQVGEVLLGEAVLGVDGRRARADALQQLVGQVRGGIESTHPSILALPDVTTGRMEA
jgi:hypothetical protein